MKKGYLESCANKIMRSILFFLIIVSIIITTGCTSTSDIPTAPVGKGQVNLCISDPGQAEYWQKTGDILWINPNENDDETDPAVVTRFPACGNMSVIIREKKETGKGNRDHVIIQTQDGQSFDGWLPAGHVRAETNETGTEWSENYYSILGLWEQTGRGNGAKIWYEFLPDGTYTFNYDMMGNRDNVQDRGSWTYHGNGTYELISYTDTAHGHISITPDTSGKTFLCGFEYTYGSSDGRELEYRKR